MPIGSSPRRHGRWALFLEAFVAMALVATACTRDGTPSPSGASPTASPPASPTDPAPLGTLPPEQLDAYRAIAAQVVEIRGLDAPDRLDPQVIDADQLRANLEADFDASNSEDLIRFAERVYTGLGLLPAGADLRDIYLDLQGSQVIGYYDPADNELYIVSRSGALGPTERLTYAHEFTHELQDLHFDLESLGLDTTDEGDRALAVLGLVEGDAVSSQTTWMTEQLTPDELGQVMGESLDPDMLEVLARTPAILLETALFPYQAGAAFVTTLLDRGGYDAVNAAFDDLPASTEQVIHPDKYLDREAPIDVAFPAELAARFGTGWTLDGQDTLGELQLRVWLREGGAAGDVAREAAEGWGGDRVALLTAPDGAGDLILIVSDWDTTADAAAFRSAAEDVVDGLAAPGSVVVSGRRVVIAIGVLGPDGAAVVEGLAGD